MVSLGQVLRERYRVDRMLEMGALEASYRGWDLETGQPVIIREILPQTDMEPRVLRTLEDAFLREAQSLVELQHPNVVNIRDCFTRVSSSDAFSATGETGAPHAYLITDHPTGQSLAERLKREHRLSEERITQWALQLLDALAYCHQRNVLHRDIQPQNIIITSDNQAMLTHFEITGLWDVNDPRTWTAKRVMGTPQYAPPERWGMRIRLVDARSDVYSLGATLYHALTGERPITADERTSNPYRFLQVKSLTRRVSASTRAVLMKAMELPQDKRYPTAAAMAKDLERDDPEVDIQIKPAPFSPKPRRGSRRNNVSIIAIAVVVVLLLGLGGLLITQQGMPALSFGASPEPPAVQSPSIDASPTPTSNPPTPTLDPASIISEQSQPTNPPTPTAPAARAPEEWAILVSDTFENNEYGWIESESSDDWGTVSRSIVDGTYRWEIQANQAVGRWYTPDLPESDGVVEDFYLAVDAQRVTGPRAAAYGLVFRQAAGNYYLFSVRDDGYYQFSLWYDYEWRPTIDWTQTEEILSGESNRISVIGRGNTFEFYINDAFIATAENDQLSSGETGLSVSTAATDDLAVFVFDNYELRTSEQVTKPTTPTE
jgi:serine/threonine-protein kinase